ncbi:uncharacterized protein RBU33_005616 isoform 3-T5 [Hipposideros larvatus]
MPKAKGETRRQKFGSRIRHARDRAAAVRQKLAEMELAASFLFLHTRGKWYCCFLNKYEAAAKLFQVAPPRRGDPTSPSRYKL